MRTLIQMIAFIGMAAIVIPPVYSIPVPPLDLQELTIDSTLIVVGEVVSIQEGGVDVRINSANHTARLVNALIRVDQILKGNGESGTVAIQFYVPTEPVGWRGVPLHRYGTFFLKSSGAGMLEFTSPYYPSVPGVSGASLTADPMQNVISAINGVLVSTTNTEADKKLALSVLSHGSKGPSSAAVLKSMLQNSDPNLRLTADAALLRSKDISGLAVAKDALLQRAVNASPDVLQDLLSAIGTVSDPRAVPDLAALVSSPVPEIRRASASGLMHTRSKDAVEPLIQLLSDPDLQVQYYSAAGLAEITGQLQWRPTHEDFPANSSKYINYWKQWAQTR